MKKKILSLMLITIFFIAFIATTVNAADFIQVNPSTNNAGKITNVAGNIFGIIRLVGMALSIGVLMILGIKYMMGSAEEKAEYKKTMIPYLIGAILLFAGTFIVSGIASLAS